MLISILAVVALAQEPARALTLERLPLDVPQRSALSNLTRGADGRAYLSWVEKKGERSGRLCFAIFEGDAWGESRTIHEGTDLFLNWADFPTLAVLADGTLLASWLKFGGPRWHDYAAVFSLSSDAGKTWSEPRPIHSDASACEHGFVSAIALDEERFGVLWLDGRGTVDVPEGKGETAVYFRTIGKSGALGEEAVVDPRVCDCCPTTLVQSKDGLLAGYRDRSLAEVRDIAHARLGRQGWTTSERIHPDDWKIEGCPVNGPRFSARGEHVVAAWFTGAGGGGGRVNAAFLRQSEGPYAFPSTIKVDEGSPVGRVDVALLEEDSALVTWLEYADGAGVWKARCVSAEGKVSTPLVLDEVSDDRSSGYMRMVSHGEGALVTWTDTETSRVHTALVKVAAD